MLSDTQRQKLLQVARQALKAACCGANPPDLTTTDPTLSTVQGAFVTLTRDGELRGCIGHIEGHLPLIETVAEMAVAAALEDPRFPPVTCEEVGLLHIEISVMSPLQRLADPGAVEVGRHGLVVSRGYQRGLLLPQVATEYGWNREEFLAHTCRKAGLPPNAWREAGTTLEIFEAEVFGEPHHP